MNPIFATIKGVSFCMKENNRKSQIKALFFFIICFYYLSILHSGSVIFCSQKTFNSQIPLTNLTGKWENISKGLPAPISIRKLVIHPKNDSILFAATSQGMFRTTNNGNQWESINTGLDLNYLGFTLNDLVISHSNPPTLFVGTSKGIFLSTNEGESWQSLEPEPNNNFQVEKIEVSPNNPSLIYAGLSLYSALLYKAGVLVSTNQGKTWTSITTKLPPAIGDIEIHPTNQSILYVAVRNAGMTDSNGIPYPYGVFRSTNGGISWELTLPQISATTLTLSPTNPNVIYCGDWSNKGIFISIDGGATWKEIGSGLPNEVKEALIENPKNPSNLFLATSGTFDSAILFSTNSGMDWSTLGNNSPSGVYTLALNSYGQTLYAGTRSSGIYKFIITAPSSSCQSDLFFPDWKTEYWNNDNFSGQPTVVKNEPSSYTGGFIREWTNGPFPNCMEETGISIRWTKRIAFNSTIKASELYVYINSCSISTNSIFIDGRRSIDYTKTCSGVSLGGGIDFEINPGSHEIRVDVIFKPDPNFSSNSYPTLIEFWPRCGFRIIQSPLSQSVAYGKRITLSIGVAQTETSIFYRWFEGESGDTSKLVAEGGAQFTTPPIIKDTTYWARAIQTCTSGTIIQNSSTATLLVYTNPESPLISGKVYDRNGNGLDGVKMNLTGPKLASTYTENGGKFVFGKNTLLINGSYTLTPVSSQHTFTPLSRTVIVEGRDVMDQEFVQKDIGLEFDGLRDGGEVAGNVLIKANLVLPSELKLNRLKYKINNIDVWEWDKKPNDFSYFWNVSEFKNKAYTFKENQPYIISAIAKLSNNSFLRKDITIFVKPLFYGRLRVIDKSDPNNVTKQQLIDKVTQGNDYPNYVDLINEGSIFRLPVAEDGTFSSRQVEGKTESDLSNGNYSVKSFLVYNDHITIDTSYGLGGGCASPPGQVLRRYTSRHLGIISIHSGIPLNMNVDYPLPILLIHGIRSCYSDWNSWATELLNQGYIVFTPNHDFVNISKETEANQIYQQHISNINLFNKPPQFFCIAHSEGGIVARVICQTEWGVKTFKRVYTIGTPHSGTDIQIIFGGLASLYGLDVQTMYLFNLKYPQMNVDTLAFSGNVLLANYQFLGNDGVVSPQLSTFNIIGTSIQTFPVKEFNFFHTDLIGPAAIDPILKEEIIPDMNR